MTLSRHRVDRNMSSGRVNQKMRTRRALLEAAAELLRQGRPPSMPEAAELALVSPATAYRYFPSAQVLWEEASLQVTEPWDVDEIMEAGDDPADRLQAVIHGLGWRMLDEELPYRNLVRSALERWFSQADVPEHERVPVRQGRRIEYNARVVEPLRDRLPDPFVDDLQNALALVWGTESVLVLRDVCRLDTDKAKDIMSKAARWMLQGALSDASAASTRPRPRRHRAAGPTASG